MDNIDELTAGRGADFNQPIFATRVTRGQAIQTHYTPLRAYYARGPFDDEMLAKPVVVMPEEPEEEFGGTAQNNFTPIRYFRCKFCDEVVAEKDLEAHDCDDYYDDEEEDDGETA